MSRNPPIHFADSRAQAPGQAVQPGYITDIPLCRPRNRTCKEFIYMST